MTERDRFRGFEVRDPGLTDLVPMVEEWLLMIDRASRALPGMHDPVPYADNEIPSSAMLCAAAWRAGLVARLEAPTTKHSAGGAIFYGRSDLWVWTPVSATYFEAKFLSPGLNKTDFSLEFAKKVDQAEQDARQISDRDARHVALAHFALSIHPDDVDRTDDILAEALSTAMSGDFSLLAWSFPTTKRMALPSPSDGWTRPGAMLAMKSVSEAQ